MFRARFAFDLETPLMLSDLRTFYYNWLISKALTSRFHLLVEDGYPSKREANAYQKVISTLNSFDLNYETLTYTSDRRHVYGIYLEELRLKNLVNYHDRRFTIKKEFLQDATYYDEKHGEINISVNELTNINNIIIMNDGVYTTFYKRMIDNWDLGYEFIINDRMPIHEIHTHVLVWNLLNEKIVDPDKEMPVFVNVKRFNNDLYLSNLLKQGYHRDALLNFVLLTGWKSYEDKKFINKYDALTLFSGNGEILETPNELDMNLLDELNNHYNQDQTNVDSTLSLCPLCNRYHG